MSEIKAQIRDFSKIWPQSLGNVHNETQSPFSPTEVSKNIQSTILDQLYTFYLYQGPAWKHIKSQTCSGLKDPKNFLYNAIRRSAKTLSKYERDFYSRRCRRGITKDSLLYLLEIINQMQKEIAIRSLTLNQESLLFTFKKSILRFSLWENSLSLCQVYDLIKLMKQIGTKLRCLSIFKAKNRKNWKLSERGLQLIYSFDQVFIQSGHRFQMEDGQSVIELDQATEKKEMVQQREESSFDCSMWSISNLLLKQPQRKEKSLEEQANQILDIPWGESKGSQEICWAYF